jgi:hypothetical protein
VDQRRADAFKAAQRQWFVTGRIPSQRPDPNDDRWSSPPLGKEHTYILSGITHTHPVLIEKSRIYQDFEEKIKAFKATDAYRVEQCQKLIHEARQEVSYYTALLDAPQRLQRSTGEISERERTRAQEIVRFYQDRLDVYGKEGEAGLLKFVDTQAQQAADNPESVLYDDQDTGDADALGQRRRGDGLRDGALTRIVRPLRSVEDGQHWMAQQNISERWKTAKSLTYPEYVQLHEDTWRAIGAPRAAELERQFEEWTTPRLRRQGGPYSVEAQQVLAELVELREQQEPKNRVKWQQWRRSSEST